jgi:threonine dehydratase
VPALDAWIGAEVSLKLENEQIGGSFKWRGVVPRVQALGPEARRHGLVCVSGGNFGLALAMAAHDAGLALHVHVPSTAEARRVEAMRSAGATVHVHDTVEAAFEGADRHARSSGALLVDDLDDAVSAQGYGSLLAELLDQAPHTRRVVLAAGGGLLAAGLCRAMAALGVRVQLDLAEPEGAPTVHAALAAATPVTVAVRTAVATLGVPRIGSGVLSTLMTAGRGSVRSWLVTDAEATEAQRAAQACAGLSIDLAAACSLALVRRLAAAGDDLRDTCVLVCGRGA